MDIDLNKTLYGVTGEELKDNEGAPMQARAVVMRALLGGCRGDDKKSREDIGKRFELAMDVKIANGSLDLTSKGSELIKESLSQSDMGYTPLILGQMDLILDGKDNPLAPDETKEG
jgi:hypothetical protein